MLAEIYLFNTSFEYNQRDTEDVIADKIQNIFITISKIRKECESKQIERDKFHINADFYYVKLFQEYTIQQLAYDPIENILGYEEKKVLKWLIDRCHPCDDSEEVILAKSRDINPDSLSGLLCLNKLSVDGVHQSYLIQTFEQWKNFHRCHLSKYPKSEEYFYQELAKYFSNIYFHENVVKSLKGLEGGLRVCAKAIIVNLTHLNDHFHTETAPPNLREHLRRFSLECEVECTLEGDIARKPDLTFTFHWNGTSLNVCCEPHLKLARSFHPGDTHYYYNRIYFHQGIPKIFGGRILVAHIGNHL